MLRFTGIQRPRRIPERESIDKKETDHTDTEYARQQKHPHRMMPFHLRHSPEQQQDAGKNYDELIQIGLSDRHCSRRLTGELDTSNRKLFRYLEQLNRKAV